MISKNYLFVAHPPFSLFQKNNGLSPNKPKPNSKDSAKWHWAMLLLLVMNVVTAQSKKDAPYLTGLDGKATTLSVAHDEVFVSFRPKADLSFAQAFSDEHPALSLKAELPIYSPMNGVLFAYSGSAGDLENILTILRNDGRVSSAYPSYEVGGEKMYVHSTIVLRPSAKSDKSSLRAGLEAEQLLTQKVYPMGANREVWLVKVPVDKNIWEVSHEWQARAEVEFAHPDIIATGSYNSIPNDPDFGQQWFLNQANDADIDAPEAWDCTTGNSNVVVAVIDGNGYDLSHPEFAGQTASPYDAVNDDNDPSPENSSANHGTPCAGLIAGLTNNSLGVASVGYNIKVKPVVIGFNASGNSFSSSSAIITAAASNVVSTPEIVAVSNSYGLNTAFATSASVEMAYSDMNANCRAGLGAVILASSGNNSSGTTIGYPSAFTFTVAVGASDQSDFRAGFSNYGSFGNGLDLVAPGVSTLTLDRTGSAGYNFNPGTAGDYTSFGGTSAACPIAAAVVGLVASAATSSQTAAQLEAALSSSCDKVNTSSYTYSTTTGKPHGTWNDEMGYGRVNAFKTIQVVAPKPAAVTCLDTVVYLDQNGTFGIDSSYVLDVANSGANISIFSITPNTLGCGDAGSIIAVNVIGQTPAGDRDTCVAMVTVIDTFAPTITCVADVVVNQDPNTCGANIALLLDSAFDNCNTPVTFQSPVVAYTFGPATDGSRLLANAVTLSIPVVPSIGSGAVLTINHRGDINEPNEKFDIEGEDGSLLGITNNGSQCASAYTQTTVSITSAQMAAWAADGFVTITLGPRPPGSNGLADFCSSNNDAFATLAYSSTVVITNSHTAGGFDASGFYPVGTTEVQFVATDGSGNQDSCTVSVTVNPVPEISISGNGQNIINGQALISQNDNTDFDSTGLQEPVVHDFLIENLGCDTLDISNISLSGSGAFQILSTTSATISDGGSSVLQIQFSPPSVGTFSATVSIDNNDADENPFTFAIDGKGFVNNAGPCTPMVTGSGAPRPAPFCP